MKLWTNSATFFWHTLKLLLITCYQKLTISLLWWKNWSMESMTLQNLITEIIMVTREWNVQVLWCNFCSKINSKFLMLILEQSWINSLLNIKITEMFKLRICFKPGQIFLQMAYIHQLLLETGLLKDSTFKEKESVNNWAESVTSLLSVWLPDLTHNLKRREKLLVLVLYSAVIGGWFAPVILLMVKDVVWSKT